VSYPFSATGVDQFYNVPNSVSFLRVYLWGAGGSPATNTIKKGGSGAYVEGLLPVIPGSTLKIVVGKTRPTVTSCIGGAALAS
jgi:hypothetical protein